MDKQSYRLSSMWIHHMVDTNVRALQKHLSNTNRGLSQSQAVGAKESSVKDKEEGRNLLAQRLKFKKVLVVLDDIDHRDQLDYLAKELVWLGNCGRIIATTRYKHLIGENL
ncbi:TMV resistance protein N-like [Solanum stenotomum]|uniref:TMV resistance protein N-like n=1 Tax=Solanum stenotomum TaxID=172797 RepID=UPI0020D00A94|nr:TMV resistance protein N-like [Solanum stenotomum]